MSYNDSMLDLIDWRIAQRMRSDLLMATVTALNSILSAMVVIDGDTVSVPVRVLGSAAVGVGDRCVVALLGSDWVIVGSFASRFAANVGNSGVFGVGNTASGTFGAAPGTPTVSGFVKRWSFTRVKARISVDMYADTANTKVEWGLSFNGAAAVAVRKRMISTTLTWMHTSGTIYVPSLAVGTISAVLQWRRAAGTGTIFVNADADWSVDLEEVGP